MIYAISSYQETFWQNYDNYRVPFLQYKGLLFLESIFGDWIIYIYIYIYICVCVCACVAMCASAYTYAYRDSYLYNALPISQGHFSPNNSRKTFIARPRGQSMNAFLEFEVWPKFYLRHFCAVWNSVLCCNTIYRESIVPWRPSITFIDLVHTRPRHILLHSIFTYGLIYV